MTKNTLVVNLFAGPCAGKSTMASTIFAALKRQGIDCELVTEYAKDLVWEGSTDTLHDQIYVFANQLRRITRLLGKVDVIINDSPILLSAYYTNPDQALEHLNKPFQQLIINEHRAHNTYNLFLTRHHNYTSRGRVHNEKEAHHADQTIKQILDTWQVPYQEMKSMEETVPHIVNNIIYQINQPQ